MNTWIYRETNLKHSFILKLIWNPLYTSVKMSDLGLYMLHLYAGSIYSIYPYMSILA